MSSWFNADSIKGLTEKVQSALPIHIDQEMIEKLTLTTPELTAERQRIDEEERRKERVRDMLAGMLPWETRDAERDILVDECKEAILQLSSDRQTFFGPYRMPEKKVKLERTGAVAALKDQEEHEVEEESTEGGAGPPGESLEKLSKLEPLPVLLQEFDLDAHVGLINRLLKEDPKLVEMQSALSGKNCACFHDVVASTLVLLRTWSLIKFLRALEIICLFSIVGGGERERIFWRNYFFHCAYTRYEAGLSIDEIWSDQPPPVSTDSPAADDERATPTKEEEEEETITFEDHATGKKASPEKAFPAEPATDADAPFESSPGNEAASGTVSAPSTDGVDFELVAAEADAVADNDGEGNNEDLADYELDELEAEIARELED